MSCPSVSSGFKVMAAAGMFLSLLDFATDIAATWDFKASYDEYSDRADTISAGVSGEEASNFKANSTFFLALSTEYDALSSFDKENVYCDIYSLQSDPDAMGGNTIFIGACLTLGLTVLAHVVGYKILHSYMTKKKVNGGVPIENLTIPFKKLHQVNLKSALQFTEVSPMVALVAAMLTRHNGLNCYDCQEKFHDCGISGDCDMSDLMLTVPLNSSLIDIFTSEKILAVSLFAGLLNLVWNFGAGVGLWIVEGAGRLLLFPCIQLSIILMPIMWVIWIEGMSAWDRLDDMEGKITIGFTIFVIVVFVFSLGAFAFFEANGTMLVLAKVRSPELRDLEDPQKYQEKKVVAEQALKRISTGPRSHATYWIIGRCILTGIRFYLIGLSLGWDMAGTSF